MAQNAEERTRWFGREAHFLPSIDYVIGNIKDVIHLSFNFGYTTSLLRKVEMLITNYIDGAPLSGPGYYELGMQGGLLLVNNSGMLTTSFKPDAEREYEIPECGSLHSNPKSYFAAIEARSNSLKLLIHSDLRSAIITGFGLFKNDNYVYHAIASVTLAQVQSAIEAGTSNGLCDWYTHKEDLQPEHPSPADISAYASIFSPMVNSGNMLKSFGANAKKGSLRASIAEHLLSKRYVSETFSPIPKPSKGAVKRPLFNPYLEFWTWSCHALRWAGPDSNTPNIKTSHAVLPIFMHHFGCVAPSREALEVIRLVAFNGNKEADKVIDLGSGNGYWTYMLRANGLPVIAVDNQQSVFRCNWINDTIIKDGAQFLKSRSGGINDVLLLVYPIVGADFFRSMLDAYKGNRLVVVGTQCDNGYTAFKDALVDEWISRERKDWSLEVRIPLPSFAGKDEALYVFKKK